MLDFKCCHCGGLCFLVNADRLYDVRVARCVSCRKLTQEKCIGYTTDRDGEVDLKYAYQGMTEGYLVSIKDVYKTKKHCHRPANLYLQGYCA